MYHLKINCVSNVRTDFPLRSRNFGEGIIFMVKFTEKNGYSFKVLQKSSDTEISIPAGT